MSNQPKQQYEVGKTYSMSSGFLVIGMTIILTGFMLSAFAFLNLAIKGALGTGLLVSGIGLLTVGAVIFMLHLKSPGRLNVVERITTDHQGLQTVHFRDTTGATMKLNVGLNLPFWTSFREYVKGGLLAK